MLKTNTPRKTRTASVRSKPQGTRPATRFPVVAIGASAGGLDAFTSLLKALPSDSGMAFVLIQHLDPTLESALTRILSKTTSMPVIEASKGATVKRNHVYVIPPGKTMTIRKGALQLARRSAVPETHLSVDTFSIALAKEQGNAAVGVVLSGMGSDGTQGLKAIKAAGGRTFAQDPATAQWPGMPISAITEGAVDSVLAPESIAAELARMGRGNSRMLDRKLAHTRENLRALVAANEEVVSSNEELQSTNEELARAREELQASNEELSILNNELQHHNAVLNILWTDLTTLLEGIEIPVLVLDADLNIRRFTPVAGTLLNLIQGDLGRPFSDIAPGLDVTNWDELLSQVVSHGRTTEREVKDPTGRRYLLRIRPYKPGGSKIEGLLVVLFDIDSMKRALEEARDARDRAILAEKRGDSILNSLRSNIAVLSPDGTITETNKAWEDFASENGASSMHAVEKGENYLEVCRKAAAKGVTGAQPALDGIIGVLDGSRTFFQLEYSCDAPAEQCWFLMNVSPFEGAGGGAVVSHADITSRKLAELAALTSQATVRALLDSSSQSVIAVNGAGNIAFVNGNTEEMFGYSQEELDGQPFELLIPESVRKRHAAHREAWALNGASRPVGTGFDLQGRHKEGAEFPVEISLNTVNTPGGKLGVAFITDISQRKKMEQSAKGHAKEIRALAASLLTAQEEERRRVSRELHDQICQQLASLAIDIGGFVSAITTPAKAMRLKSLQARVVRVSEQTRHLAYELHPSVLDDLGLVASIRDLCKQFSGRDKLIVVTFKNTALPAVISREVASCVYRVAQESLQNVKKHAGATHVSVSIKSHHDELQLSVTDDGRGFNLGAVKGGGGLGLIGMEERAHMLTGKLSVITQPGHGTQIALHVPLQGGTS